MCRLAVMLTVFVSLFAACASQPASLTVTNATGYDIEWLRLEDRIELGPLASGESSGPIEGLTTVYERPMWEAMIDGQFHGSGRVDLDGVSKLGGGQHQFVIEPRSQGEDGTTSFVLRRVE